MHKSIQSAVILVAGRGSRLENITEVIPKCLVKVNNQSILERMLTQLAELHIKNCILVVGYLKEVIINSIGHMWKGIEIEYVENPIWAKTNNIYSLYLALPFIKEDFVLIEGDIVVEKKALKKMLVPNSIAIDNYKHFMSGTIVDIHKSGVVSKMILSDSFEYPTDPTQYFKTVNIYSFHILDFIQNIATQIEQHILKNKVSIYYEIAISEAISGGKIFFTAVDFSEHLWSEIDTQKDLFYAEKLFKTDPLNKF